MVNALSTDGKEEGVRNNSRTVNSREKCGRIRRQTLFGA
jgi:hypothetical protein